MGVTAQEHLKQVCQYVQTLPKGYVWNKLKTLSLQATVFRRTFQIPERSSAGPLAGQPSYPVGL